jgi:PAS domain S-box-containing protein
MKPADAYRSSDDSHSSHPHQRRNTRWSHGMQTVVRQYIEAGSPEAEQRAQELLEALPAAICTTDLDGRITFYNQAAATLWGRQPDPGNDQWCGSWKLRWPDGRLMEHAECPIATAIREQRSVRGLEAVAERPDGSLVPFMAFATPLKDASGAMVGAVNMLVDLSDRHRVQHTEQLLSSIVESSDDAIISKDLNGVITTWNKGAQRIFGYTAEEMVGKPVALLIPAVRHDEEPEILARIRRGERIDHYETVRCRKDGTEIDISLTVSPIKNAAGQIVGASKIARDITERRRHQEQQRLLHREMNHRVKNSFAVAGALVTLSVPAARTPKELAKLVQVRLAALARAHELTQPDPEGQIGASAPTMLRDLIEAVLRPFTTSTSGAESERIVVEVPDLALRPAAVTALALIVSELGTNAAKHGALSVATGRVQVGARQENARLLLVWTEEGGPALAGPPDQEGFGSVLVQRMVKGQLGGEMSVDWKPAGLVVTLAVPLGQIAAAPA